MMQPEVVVDGQYLSAVMPWGDLEWVDCWPGGTESITYGASRTHRSFRPDATVQLSLGGRMIVGGLMTDPSRGEPITAEGFWRKAEDEPALNGAGEPANNTNDAMDSAVARGLQWKGRRRQADFAPVPGVDGNPKLEPGLHTLRTFIDASLLQRGLLWGVDGDGYAYHSAWPAATLHMLPGLDGLEISRDGFASVLHGRFLNAADNTYYTATREDSAARKRWGRVPYTLQEPLGEGVGMTAAIAQDILKGIFDQGRSQIGWTSPLEIAYGDVVTSRGQAVHPALIRSGMTMRLHGLNEDVGDLGGQTFIDMRIARVTHRTDGTALVEPLKLSSPMADALAAV